MFGNPEKIVNSLNGNTEWTNEQLLEGKILANLIREGKTKSELAALGYGTDSVGVFFKDGNLVFQPLMRDQPFPNAERPVAAVAAVKARS